tara:strand:+ start:502 stop:1716 length:1215 start_codon:yes stop_codon:yes gene_type:complete
MKRIKTLLLALIMTTMTLSGCIGNSDVETSEGDDVELGESPDDWPTYYVQSSGDLPTCDSSTLGRLYYVEDDVNFQACMSTGWEVVDIGGANSNIVLNQPPILSAKVWSTSGGETYGYLVDDGDGTMSIAFMMEWFAYDLDGTVTSVGIDQDMDGVVDITFPSNSGAIDSQSSIQLANGDTLNGGFLAPLEVGTSYSRITDFTEDDESPLVECGLIIQKSFFVIASDDSGASTTIPIVAPLNLNVEGSYRAVDGLEVQEELYQSLSIPQADLDWLTGQGSSTCPTGVTFTVVDHPDSLTSQGGDNIATITISNTADWSHWSDNTDWGENWKVDAYCFDSNDQYTTRIEAIETFNGADEDSPQDGDTISIVDNTNNNCDSSHDRLQLYIRMDQHRESISIVIPIS